MIVPRHVLGGPGYTAPSDTLNVASVGIGGQGMEQMRALLAGGQNIVAICDVDFGYVERSINSRVHPANNRPVSADTQKIVDAYQKARKYADFREMLDKQKDIDAVVVATPDHNHAQVAYRAMKMGKHVYVQKPLTYSVYESRVLAKTAAETKVVTQMGNQGHSGDGTRRIVEIVRSGVLGDITEAHIWTDRPVTYWAQGIPRPVATLPPPRPHDVNAPPQWNLSTVTNAVARAMIDAAQAPPSTLNWELFLGCSPDVAYHPVYHPFSWRGWIDFGVGALGDMGAHLVDQAFWALDLTYPTSIVASSTLWGFERKPGADGKMQNVPASYPLAQTVEYEFAARGSQPPVKLFWYDGGLLPPRCAFIPDTVIVKGDGGGGLIVGTKGAITYETYGDKPTVYPESVAAQAAAVPQSIPRIVGSHEMNWAQAAMGHGVASSPFEYGARLNETMVLGVAALRAGQGRKVLYDAARMEFTNAPDANQYLTREYRHGWELPAS
jgi:predicted dehydrogenase